MGGGGASSSTLPTTSTQFPIAWQICLLWWVTLASVGRKRRQLWKLSSFTSSCGTPQRAKTSRTSLVEVDADIGLGSQRLGRLRVA